MKISLDDKYALEEGRVFMSGLQALVRLPMVQMRRDRAAGLNTGAYISGYRGSPLGGYDIQLARAKQFLDAHGVVVRPGVNEELAASAVWGTQQLHLSPGAQKDGVVGIWYGKGPGVDRSGDVLKHGNAAGSAANGGVLCLAGDDHSCKSSTIPHQSDHAFMSALMPVLYPSSVHEFIEMGLFGVAMSRYSGCWVGMKFVSDTVESSAVVDLQGEQRTFVLPQDFQLPQGGVNLRWPDPPLVQDERLQEIKGYAAVAFARANGIDKVVSDSSRARLGIVASGIAFEDVREALRYLGVDGVDAAGIRLYKVGMPWPLEHENMRAFAEGLEEILVIEDRREMIENQIKQVLFNWHPDVRPRIVGKFDEHGKPFFSHSIAITAETAARGIAERLLRMDLEESLKNAVRAKSERLAERERELQAQQARPLRLPFYCSGCPHNTSTRVPEGSLAMAGIGCHYMVMWMERNTQTFSQMGGEGVAWAGTAPFTSESHRFVNLGDGTYFHSGILAVRQAVAAGVNITYKVLYNGAVAMTGGQSVDGELPPEVVTWQLHHEGVHPIWFVSERPQEFSAAKMAPGVMIKHRDEMDAVMREAREHKGCSAIVYEQMCAAERRRKRKRGELPDPPRRAFIHTEVCEGCGDCSEQSNCASVEPVQTPFGTKRRINQTSCNKDFSCIKGFCPSFVTIEGGELKKPAPVHTHTGADNDALPTPTQPVPGAGGWNIIAAGVGGTGVLTIGALLGTAAQVDGLECTVLDMAGLAQKGGKVLGQIRFGAPRVAAASPQIIAGGADVLLAADMLAAAAPDAAKTYDKTRTYAVANTHLLPSAEFVLHGKEKFDENDARGWMENAASRADFFDFSVAAEEVAGDALATNIVMIGFASQKGLLPPSPAAIEEAIKLNGVAVEANLAAFARGRKMALEKQPPAPPPPAAITLEEVIAHRRAHLAAYQDEALAQKYEAAVAQVATAVEQKGLDPTLTRAVAENYAKVLAPKDEYEVARLFSQQSFYDEIAHKFAGGELVFHLAPPFLPGRDASGRPRKYAVNQRLARAAFGFLQRMKKHRGGILDIFAHSHDRREERALIPEYEALLAQVLPALEERNQSAALALLNFPATIRGYGPVKSAAIEKARQQKEIHLRAFTNPPPA